MSDTTIQQPEHGAYGARIESGTFSPLGTSYQRTWTNERWCEKCQAWIRPSGATGIILASVGCPKCQTLWR